MCKIHSQTAVLPRPRQQPPAARPADLDIDQSWKEQVYDFTRDNLEHTAWGLQHSERDYLLSKDIARQSRLQVDQDVLFAAAFLHDMGGFPGFQKEGVDHAIRSAEVCDQILRPAGFPEEKIEDVRSAIRTHSYYSKEAPETPEGAALHDADCLDFLGAVGVARILSLTQREPFTPTLESAVKLAENLKSTAGKTLYSGDYARQLADSRIQEMDLFLTRLDAESFGRKHL
ncbi:hypothetical protein ABS71_22735 [bacterium SCN 62-11]|nr:HD domain-containing protein [Candidatus Eremiobacteraeota bacterium]ODT55612.1 MAG: hypothetical protein ABS71_22735 [bacterium SCN 62-11]